jgi:hypothetical protein
MYWLLAREVLYLRGKITHDNRIAFNCLIGDKSESVMPDLYFYRSPEEMKKEEQELAHKPELEHAPMEVPFLTKGMDFKKPEFCRCLTKKFAKIFFQKVIY